MKNFKSFRKGLLIVFFLTAFAFSFVPDAAAAGPEDQFEKYRQTIQKEYGIDIANFKDSMEGGRADGKPITKYDLDELLIGINVEQEHTTSKMRALEIATDHLEEFRDYYTRLLKMEKEAEEEAEKNAEKKEK